MTFQCILPSLKGMLSSSRTFSHVESQTELSAQGIIRVDTGGSITKPIQYVVSSPKGLLARSY